MFKKYLTLILATLIINFSLSATAFAETKEEKVAKFTEKIKANIAKLGTGKDAHIEVKLRDGIKVKGFVSQIDENSFAVTDEKTGNTTEVPYSRAKQVKGNNLSDGVKIAIGIGIAVVALLIVGYILGVNE